MLTAFSTFYEAYARAESGSQFSQLIDNELPAQEESAGQYALLVDNETFDEAAASSSEPYETELRDLVNQRSDAESLFRNFFNFKVGNCHAFWCCYESSRNSMQDETHAPENPKACPYPDLHTEEGMSFDMVA